MREKKRASQWNENITHITIYCHAIANLNYGLGRREKLRQKGRKPLAPLPFASNVTDKCWIAEKGDTLVYTRVCNIALNV